MMAASKKLTTQRFTLGRIYAALCQVRLKNQKSTLSTVKLSVILSKSSPVEIMASCLSSTLKCMVQTMKPMVFPVVELMVVGYYQIQ